jgi:hypothetical protein
MVFTKCPVYGLFATSCRPENGSEVNFAMEPFALVRIGVSMEIPGASVASCSLPEWKANCYGRQSAVRTASSSSSVIRVV